MARIHSDRNLHTDFGLARIAPDLISHFPMDLLGMKLIRSDTDFGLKRIQTDRKFFYPKLSPGLPALLSLAGREETQRRVMKQLQKSDADMI